MSMVEQWQFAAVEQLARNLGKELDEAKARLREVEAELQGVRARAALHREVAEKAEARVAELEEAINAAMTEIEDANSPYQPFRVAAILRATETL